MAKVVNGVVQHVHRVESASAMERPTTLLIGLDQRYQNIELVTLRGTFRCPQSFSISASATRWSLSVRIGRMFIFSISRKGIDSAVSHKALELKQPVNVTPPVVAPPSSRRF